MEGEGIAKTVFMAMWYMLVGIFYLIKWIVVWTIYLIKMFRNTQPKTYIATDTTRFEHTHILGGSGHGKSQLMQSLILDDLPRVIEGKCSLVVIDSQGDMIDKILSLVELSPEREDLAKRLVLIDPTDDLECLPCLNLFDFGQDRTVAYNPLEKETIKNGAIAMYEYIFGALLGAEMTNNQEVTFRYIARLLMEIPGATIYTMLDFMADPELVKPHLKKLDITAQRFFLTQFLTPAFDSRRQQILNRLWGILEKDTIRKMFSHEENKINLFEAMNNGSLILINTAKSLLKPEGCELFGRFMIALLTQATQERAAISESERKPTFVYIDEAQDYFEEGAGIEILLTQARKYRVGLVFAHQSLNQLSRGLTKTVLSNTSTKYVGGVSNDDAVDMAREMKCTPDFIRMMQKTATTTSFAIFVKDHHEQPTEYIVGLGLMEGRPKMSAAQRAKLLEDNRARYCAPYDPQLLMGSQAIANIGIQFELAEPPTL